MKLLLLENKITHIRPFGRNLRKLLSRSRHMPGTTAHESPIKRKLLALYRAFIGTVLTIEGPDDSKARNNKYNCNTTEYNREGEPRNVYKWNEIVIYSKSQYGMWGGFMGNIGLSKEITSLTVGTTIEPSRVTISITVCLKPYNFSLSWNTAVYLVHQNKWTAIIGKGA